MESLIKQVIATAIPPNESLKSSDFFGSVNILQTKIIDIFRYSSLQFVPPFLNGMLSTILQNSNSQDKRTRFSTAICVTALIHLFPFDDYVIYYRPVIEKLLVPGYRPILEIGALVVSRLAKISGNNRNMFLSDLIEKNRVFSSTKSSTEVKYTAALIWKALAHIYPEGFFSMKESLYMEIQNGIRTSDNSVGFLLIATIKELFNSEAASIGAPFLDNMHDFFTNHASLMFASAQKAEDLKVLFELLHILLKHRPYFSVATTQEYILPQCYRALQCPDFSIVALSMDTIIMLYKTKAMKITKNVEDTLFKILVQWSVRDPAATEHIFSKVIFHFSNKENSDNLLNIINTIFNKLPVAFGPLYAFNLVMAVLEAGKTSIVSSFLLSVSRFMEKSAVPVPIHKVLKILNQSYPNWSKDFIFFKNQMIHVIRQELSNPSMQTDRLVISMKSIQQIPSFSYIDSIELNCLVMKYTTSKDLEIREEIVASIVHLFKDHPEQIPLNTMIDLVKFALDDRVISVRKRSLRAFTEITYQYIEQPDVFEEFCKFCFDESPIIRKESITIIKNLHTYDLSAIRQLILQSMNLMNSNFDILVPETTPVWIVFPRLLLSAHPIIHIYADSIYQIFMRILSKRFQESKLKETTLIFMNSAILKEIDESLIKSVTRLYMLCPHIISIRPILGVFCSVLRQPVHPWTKENVLKALKNLSNAVSITSECPEIVNALMSIIHSKESTKLVTKTLKVMGSIGVLDVPLNPTKEPLILRSSLTNVLYFKQFYLRIYFKYLNDLFDSGNIDSTREAIATSVAKVYSIEPGCIQQNIEPFMTRYLNFIKNSSTDRMPNFLSYLREMINSAGHLIIPYTDRIFQAIEEHWHDRYTKEASDVFAVLVMTTDGRCDSILHLLVSVSFLLMRSKKELQNSARQIFNMLCVIAKYCPSYLQSIIDGAVSIMSTPGSPAYLQQQSLDTIEFIINNANVGPHLSMIIRCLNSVAMRSQMIWREQARKLLAQVEMIPRDLTVVVKKNKKKKKTVDHLLEDGNAGSFRLYAEFEEILEHFVPPRKTDKSRLNILNWFDDLRKYLIRINPAEVMKTMLDFPTLPKFAFKFAFYSLWSQFSLLEKEAITEKLDKIFLMFDLPTFVMAQFVGLVELSVLAEIDLGVDLQAVINSCISANFNTKALFFLENLIDPTKCPNYSEKLIKMNVALNRNHVARALAEANRSSVKVSVWMSLSEWETALELISNEVLSSSDQNKFLIQKVECLAAMENWKEIKDMKPQLMQQPRNVQAKLARFMWIAELLQGSKEEALECVNLTGGYTVDDCIQKAILYIHMNKLLEANDTVHLGWRYLASAVVSNVRKNSRRQLTLQIFQAEQLHELAEVIDIRTDPSLAAKLKETWLSRLQFIKNDPDKQEELFKIRSLVPDCIDLTEFAYSILQSTLRTQKALPRLIEIFFPDPMSENAKYCKMKLILDRSERINSAQKLLSNDTCSVDIKKRLNNFLGKETLDFASTVDDLKEGLFYLIKGEKNIESIAQVQILISLLQKDEDLAVTATASLKKCLEAKPAITLHQLEALSINFPKSKRVSKAIMSIFAQVPYENFRVIEGTCILSLSHPSKHVMKVARVVCSLLATHLPHSIIFDLVTNIERHPKLNVFEDLSKVVQSTNPIFYSQMMRLISKLKLITNTLFDRWIEQLKLCLEAMQAKKFDKAYDILKTVFATTKQAVVSRYNANFMNRVKSNWGSYISQTLLAKGRLVESDTSGIQSMIVAMIKKQDAIRVIPLSSLDVELESNADWSIPIVGKDDKNDLKIVKFFHSVQRLDNGLRIAVIGTNGKKYGFHIVRGAKVHAQQSEQFMNLLNALTPLALNQRTLVEVSPNLSLFELLKGHIQLHDLVSMYQISKGRQPEEEYNNIERCFLTFSHTKLVRKLEFLTKDADTDNLRQAFLVTSKSATMYIHRTTMFAKSMGTLAAVSYLIGSVDNTPHGLLVDKTTGEVTYTNFHISGVGQPVPFRLTRMIVDAFGPCGVKGPFLNSFLNALKNVRKFASAIATFAIFAIGDAPFDVPMLPSQYTKKYAQNSTDVGITTNSSMLSSSVIDYNMNTNTNYNANANAYLNANTNTYMNINMNANVLNDDNTIKTANEIDEFYSRFVSNGTDLNSEIDHLIHKASSLENLAKMPANFYAWW